MAPSPPRRTAWQVDAVAELVHGFHQDRAADLRGDLGDGVAASGEPGKVGQDAAVLGDVGERNPVQHRDQRVLVQQRPQLGLGPEPTG